MDDNIGGLKKAEISGVGHDTFEGVYQTDAI